jgi:DNA-binding response OmpR family regulator
MSAPTSILLVEDSETQALKMQGVLEEQGWSVTWSPTAEAALTEINKSLPHLIIVDFYLPGIQGDEFCRRVRMNMNTRNIPVLMLTGNEKDAGEVHSLESGADDYIPKSADEDILLLRIRSLLRKTGDSAATLGPGQMHFHQARILAVDDSPTFQQYLVGELSEEGYEVKTASSGKEALEMFSKEVFDGVLVDLVMPDVDGIQVCNSINALRSSLKRPVVVLMLTAHESKDDLTRALAAGADDFVGKSNDAAVLKGRIRALLRRKFFQEENQRILEELKNKELETVRAKAAQEAAETRAAMAEQLEKTAAELQRSNKELERFAHVVSHDLKAPLDGITSLAGWIAEDFATKIDEEGQQQLKMLVDRVKKMRSLIEGILRYSKVGWAKEEKEKVDLKELATEAVEMLSPPKHIEMKVSPDLPTVLCDRTRMRQVFQNLLSNAIKYMDKPKGEIRIACVREGDFHRISVEDNGPGIEEKHFDRVFQLFQTVTKKDDYTSTGVGLAVVKKIIEDYGGKIWVESKFGHGSSFIFTMPT